MKTSKKGRKKTLFTRSFLCIGCSRRWRTGGATQGSDPHQGSATAAPCASWSTAPTGTAKCSRQRRRPSLRRDHTVNRQPRARMPTMRPPPSLRRSRRNRRSGTCCAIRGVGVVGPKPGWLVLARGHELLRKDALVWKIARCTGRICKIENTVCGNKDLTRADSVRDLSGLAT